MCVVCMCVSVCVCVCVCVGGVSNKLLLKINALKSNLNAICSFASSTFLKDA